MQGDGKHSSLLGTQKNKAEQIPASSCFAFWANPCNVRPSSSKMGPPGIIETSTNVVRGGNGRSEVETVHMAFCADSRSYCQNVKSRVTREAHISKFSLSSLLIYTSLPTQQQDTLLCGFPTFNTLAQKLFSPSLGWP
jgi:hypothetical protein